MTDPNLAAASCGDDRQVFFNKVAKKLEEPKGIEEAMMFLGQVAQGGASGTFDEWVQLRGSCKTALARIAELEARIERWGRPLDDAVSELAKIQEAAGDEDPIALIEAAKKLPVYADTGKRFAPVGEQNAPWMMVIRSDGGAPLVTTRPIWHQHGRWVPMDGEPFLARWSGLFYSTAEAAEAARGCE